MDFGWSASQASLYDAALSFAQGKLGGPVVEHEFSHERWTLCSEFGLAGLSAPQAHGGMGLDAQTTARVLEAFGRGCPDLGLLFSASAHLFACVMPLAEHGGEELRARVLPALTSGAWIGANAITEAGAGSDAFALKTRAERVGDEYVLHGEKSYVTNGPVADVFLVYASTNPSDGYLGISAFAVERGTPGLVIGKPFRKMGLTTAPISQIYFENCRVPAANLVGVEGKGASIFNGSMQWERACLFAIYLGAMESQLERVVEHAVARKQFRKSIGKNQSISHRIVDMKLRLDSARLMLYRACWKADRGEDASLEIAASKLAVSEAAIQAGLDAIQIHGGLGFMEESGIERALRDAVPATIFSGTSEIQRDLIARKLGLG